jgi:3-oxoacyl-[acyl-carrier-protein] synthase III
MGSLINGVGSYIPEKIVKNRDFLTHQFYSDFNTKIEEETASIIRKFEKITGIAERRYVNENQNNDEIALSAAQKALAASSINKEELDYLIVAHNFGNVSFGSNKTDLLPSIATRVKHALEIENNNLDFTQVTYKINLAHSFFSRFERFKKESDYQPIVSIIKSLILAELISSSQGTTNAGNIRLNFNNFLNNV